MDDVSALREPVRVGPGIEEILIELWPAPGVSLEQVKVDAEAGGMKMHHINYEKGCVVAVHMVRVPGTDEMEVIND